MTKGKFENQTVIEEKSSTIKKNAILGASWTIVFQVFSNIIRLGSNLLLAWLLVPEVFGLMAIVNIFLQGLQLLSDVGVSANIVRHKEADNPDFYNTMWTLQIIRGVIQWVACIALAKPVSWFYKEPKLALIISVMSICLLIIGFQSTSIAIMRRHLQVKKLVLLELSVQLVTMIVTVLWVILISPTVWGLVAGSIMGYLINTTVSHKIIKGHKNQLKWDKKFARSASHFGRWIFVSTAFYFLSMQSDRIILGKFASIEVLGIFHIALQLAQIPFSFLVQLNDRIIYPMLSKYRNVTRENLNENLKNIKNTLFPALVVSMMTILICARLFFETLYKSEYHLAGKFIPFLVAMLWVQMLIVVVEKVPLVFGKSKILAFKQIISFVIRASLGILGYYLGNVEGLVIGFTAGSLIVYIVLVRMIKKLEIEITRGDAKFTLTLIILFIMYSIVYHIITPLLPIAYYILPILVTVLMVFYLLYKLTRKVKIKDLIAKAKRNYSK